VKTSAIQVGPAPPDLPSWLASSEALRPVLLAESRSALDAFDAAHPEHTKDDMRITYFVTWGPDMQQRVQTALEGAPDTLTAESLLPPAGAVLASGAAPAALSDAQSQHCALITHVCALPSRPDPPVHLLVRGAPRHNAGAKSSEWVKQRAGLEALLHAGSKPLEEIVLHTEEGGLLEGLSTNVATVTGGGVVTPHDGILHGTVREVLLEAVQAAGIRIYLTAPSVGHMAACTGVAVSSTSRLALPGSTLALPVAMLQAACAAQETDSELHALTKRCTAAWLDAVTAAPASAAASSEGEGGGSQVAPPLLQAELGNIFESSTPGVLHMPHPSGDGGSFVFVNPPPGSSSPPLSKADLAGMSAEQADTLPRMRYRVKLASDPTQHSALDFFTTQVPPSYRDAGVAGKLAQAALDTTAALGARAKPTCSYLHATYVPRHLGYMDVVTEVTADMQQAAEEALRAAAGEGAGSQTPARLGQLQPSQVSMQTSQEYDGHVQVVFSLSPVSQLLAAMVQAQVQSHSARVR